MKKFLVITWMLVLPAGVLAQEPDTLNKANEKKTHWLVGVDAFSALNAFSIIGGIEITRSRYSLSLSHFWNSSRFGVYYDYNVIKKYRLWIGLGLHASFKFEDFDQSRAEYKDSLTRNNIESTTTTFAFLPNYGEVRNLYFLSFSTTKGLKLYKGLTLAFKLEGIFCYNPFYDMIGVWGLGGAQLYCKW